MHRLPLLLAAWPLLLATGLPAQAQQGSERVPGLLDHSPRWHALTGARLVLAPGQVLPQGTVLLRDGVIVAVGADLPVPAGAREWPLAGRTVYAGFIDLAASHGVPEALRAAAPSRPPWGLGSELPPPAGPRPPVAAPSQRSSAARNRFVRAEQDLAAQWEPRADEGRVLRELGFGAVLATPQAGVWRGQGALVSTAPVAAGSAVPGGAGATAQAGGAELVDAKAALIQPRASQHLAFEYSHGGGLAYPSALMGAVALARQTLLDARWQQQQLQAAAPTAAPTAASTAAPMAAADGAAATPGRPGAERVVPNSSLAALLPVLQGRQPVVFRAQDELDAERLLRLRDEFGLRAWLHGSGLEYRRAAALAAGRLPVLVPLDFPAPPDLSTPDAAIDIPLQALQHWEQAPSNAALLHRAGVPLAFTAFGLRTPQREFWPRLRQAVRRGLPAEAALAALTTNPAAWLGESARLGRLAPGQIANLVVARGDLFTQDDAAVELVFVDGRPQPLDGADRPDPRGRWQLAEAAGPWLAGSALLLAGSATQPRLQAGAAAAPADCPLQSAGSRGWQLRWPCAPDVEPAARWWIVGELRDGRWEGTVQQGNGPLRPWRAQRVAGPAAAPPGAEPAAEPPPPPPAPGRYPAGAHGRERPAQPPLLLLRGATLWTQGPAGVLPEADLLVRAGRIAAVGRQLPVPAGAEVIDARGRHITPGLIDAHSHSAIAGGVNEYSHSVTAEVRVADALDPTDVDLYRQLAGGLTVANLMHGSANAIGGQTQTIKLRWGEGAEGLVFQGARPGIKFALGENVKRAGEDGRYPATRMGVEQVLRDAFEAARLYQAAWDAHRARPQQQPAPRRDLQLEALAELLARQRVIHVHSYRADEILMFARLAAELRLEVAAFQHVLEGYKVADAIAAIGAGASTFSDWWGYKMEVSDAVPHNGALLHRRGVLTSFNSDDGELARRLNTEAAKAQKYGGLSETEALALVTLNPARQLGIADRVGSLEPGKDADFVVWSHPPLSTQAVAEQTWIDGRRYFDRAEDRQRQQQAEAERQRLLAAVQRATARAGGPGTGGSPDPGADPRPAGNPPAARETIAAADLGAVAWQPWLRAAAAWGHAYNALDGGHACTAQEERP